MSLKFAFVLLCTLVFAGALPSASAFVDTSALREQIGKIEEELAPDGGLGPLLEALEETAGESAANYLQLRMEGKETTVWDVKKSDWFYPHVLALMELGIVSGYKDKQGKALGAYGPADHVTHEQALKIALGAAGTDPAGCGDTAPAGAKSSEWAMPYAVCAAQMNFGIASSTNLQTPATRAEVLHYLLRAFDADVPDGTPPFVDSGEHPYKNDIAYAYALGIISGDKKPDGTLRGTFRPNAPVNRAETAKMAKLAIDLL